MDDVSAVAEMIKGLPDDHRQRLISFIWLLSQVDAQRRSAAIQRLAPLLNGGSHDEQAFIDRLEETIEDLRNAIDREAER